jgi:spore coat polysaccharide biosynthesis protein SpsF
MKPRTVAIVQARMGSARFPGKMLALLGGRPLLEWVLRRVSRAKQVDETVLATSTESRDDALAALAEQIGVRTCRGDESDVLGRLVSAAEMCNAAWVVRVCADNPFIDPDEIDRLVTFFQDHACDYACNHMDRLGSRYADGFGAEILSADLLRRVAVVTAEDKHREHVTLYLWDHAREYRLLAVPAPTELAHPEMRFDVDVPADLAGLEQLVAAGVGLKTPAPRIAELQQARHAALGTVR